MKNEKNRPGEPFDAHANEDNYFALKEHELIEEMKSDHQKAAAAKRQALMATCPKCAGKLANYTVKGVDIERCESCEGMWLSKGELAEILRRQAGGPLGAFIARCLPNLKSPRRLKERG